MLEAIFIALSFVAAILVGLVLCVLVWGLYVNPLTGVWLVVFLSLAEMWVIRLPGVKLGILLYPQDLAASLMALAVLLRVLGGGQLARIPKSWALLGTLMLISFVLGSARFGTAAGVEFRSDFYFWVATAYFVSFPMTREHLSGFVRAWLFASMVILAVVYYRWTADVLALDWIEPLWHGDNPTGVAFRVINAGQTMVLGEVLILLVYAMASGAGLRNWRFLVPFLGITILVLQHRSVWAAVLGSIVLAFVLVGKNRMNLGRNLAVIGLVLAVVLVPLLAGDRLSSITSTVKSSAEAAVSTTHGTFVGRVIGWQQVLGLWMGSGLRGYAVGNPYGSGSVITQTAAYSRQQVSMSPHNHYIQTLLRTGLIGLAALLFTYWMVLRWLTRRESFNHPDVSAAAFIGLLAAQLLLFIPYGAGMTEGVVLGIAMSLVRDASVGWCRPSLHQHNDGRKPMGTRVP